ncbi:glycosyltransferase family 10 (fucosyltransferase) [mine drainage metagenome]|uniref:Glycosyltransferase family 10 (Fucosyltransferase) n=1 Tax=mine drainage metagenome TaxID=410659 RepID=A0A1J5PU30_9ZZZZ
MDRPREGHPLIEALMKSDIKKYLLLYECEIIKPDNWDQSYHSKFDRIFTWNDNYTDGHRYIKNNFVTDPLSIYNFDVLDAAFEQRKLVTIIAGAKASQHPNELYSHRVRAIKWFEQSAPDDFDLYGFGWPTEVFPSYRGLVSDKLDTLSHYRFSICYENADGIPSYITEKITDCFRAGTIPVYGGAPNINHWFPQDCYININQFETYNHLYDYMKSMPAEVHSAYLKRIKHLIESDNFYPFTTGCFIKTLSQYLAWDIQLARSASPALLTETLDESVNSSQYELVQNVKTMDLSIEKLDVDKISDLPASTKDSNLSTFASAGRPDLIVSFAYGPELPVFLRSRALWQFFIQHYPNVKVIFFKESEKLNRGETHFDGHDLLIGVGGSKSLESLEPHGYAASGVWSPGENARCIYRQMALYDYLLRSNQKPFYLYQATITSVVDFRGLTSLIDQMPRTACYAGMPGRLNSPKEYAGLTFACGTNSLFSSDMLALMRSRYDPDHIYATLPNDIWQALVLKDIPRLCLPYFSFVKPRPNGGRHSNVGILTKRLMEQGHFHFRVKTTSNESGFELRENTDPWIMLQVMEAILETLPAPAENLKLIYQLTQSVSPVNGISLGAYDEMNFFSGTRSFPLNDIEAELIFPDLAATF